MFNRTLIRMLMLSGIAAFSSTASAAADAYPSRPIRWIIDFPAGGVSDILARTVGQRLSEALGKPLVYDNRPGASGIIAYELAAKAPSDGYTIAFISTPFAFHLNLRDKLPYNTEKDFQPITLFAQYPNLLIVHPKSPVGTVREFLAMVKARPTPIPYGSLGIGSPQHLAMEFFRRLQGFPATHVPYSGSPAALTDLIGGRTEVMFANVPGAMGQIRAGRVKAIAVASASRSSVLPDVPTFAEAGYPFEAVGFGGAAAPAGVPKAIIAKLNAEMVRTLQMPEVQEQIRNVGGDTRFGSPEDFRKFLQNEIRRWAPVIKESGAKSEI